MHEEFTGQQADDFIGRYPTIGGTDPEIIGRLLPHQLFEKRRILCRDLCRPLAVAIEKRL